MSEDGTTETSWWADYVGLFLFPLLGAFWFLLQSSLSLQFRTIAAFGINIVIPLQSIVFNLSYCFLAFSIALFVYMYLRGFAITSRSPEQVLRAEGSSSQLFTISFTWFPYSLLLSIVIQGHSLLDKFWFDAIRLRVSQAFFEWTYALVEILGILGSIILCIYCLYRFTRSLRSFNATFMSIGGFLSLFALGACIYYGLVQASFAPFSTQLNKEVFSVNDTMIVLDVKPQGIEWHPPMDATLNGTVQGRKIWVERSDGTHFVYVFDLSGGAMSTLYRDSVNRIEIRYQRGLIDAFLRRYSTFGVEFLSVGD